MSQDDLEPILTKGQDRGLDDLSIESLKEYIGELKDEIERVKQVIKSKEGTRENAGQFFKN
jgi:uncharacterized small protein (DUF1192 family)